MKKLLMLLIAFILTIPCFVLWWDVIVNNVSNLYSQCNPLESHTYWVYLNSSQTYYPYDDFRNTSANSYVTLRSSSLSWTSVDIYKRNSGVLSKCSNWKRTSSAVRQGESKMVIESQDWCKFNIPSYTKTSNPSAVDVQLHYRIWFVQFNYWSNHITDNLFFTTHGLGYVTCFTNNNNVSNWSSCPSTTISYSQEYSHLWECLNYKLFWCWDWLVNSETWANYNNGYFYEVCDDWTQNGQPWHCNTTCDWYVPSGPVCWNGNLEDWEQCEKVNGSFLPGCSNCLLQTPNCTVSVSPNTWNVPKYVTITKTMSNWATVVYLNVWEWSNITNPSFPYHYTYNNPWSYQIKLKVRNNYDSYWVPYNWNLNDYVARCYAYFTGYTPAPYCWDGIINQSSEDCDPGSGNFWDGCNSSCKLMTPSCSLTANPTNWTIPLTTAINWSTNAWWGRIVYLNFWDGNIIWNGRDWVSLPQNHTYNTAWTF